MVNKILNILLVTKITKKLVLYAYTLQKWVYYIKDILIWLNVYIFFIKDGNILIKVASFQWKKKESFQCFYIPVILFGWVYREDANYYPKLF